MMFPESYAGSILKRMWCAGMVCLLLVPAFSRAAFALDGEFDSAVIISRRIKPYMEVRDGIVETLADKGGRIDVYFLYSRNGDISDTLESRLDQGQYRIITAIGPEAAIYLWKKGGSALKMFAAVLDPDRIDGLPRNACGIALRIPAQIQVRQIVSRFGNINRIGLLYDPRHNEWFHDRARDAGTRAGVDIIPMRVNSKKEIVSVLKSGIAQKIDMLWMIPDRTVISERIIQYVIKQGIYAGIGVAGYNDYFTRSGALFSFNFDYTALGCQAGEKMVQTVISGGCVNETPVFDIRVNQKVAQKLGVRVK